MPPKRKAAAAKGAGAKVAKVKAPPKRKAAAANGACAKVAKVAKKGGKATAKAVGPITAANCKQEDKPEVKDIVSALKNADKGKKPHIGKKDEHCCLYNGEVLEDYDCMLNQTNIGNNNNKFYVIQVLESSGRFYAWNRWGRVGEPGANKLSGPLTQVQAISEFKKKFRDKTKNSWDERATFNPATGKYTLLEMDGEEEEGEVAAKLSKLDEVDGVRKQVRDCTLSKPTQDLVKLIFNHDMFKEAMASMEIDVKKMPLGKLSKSQIAKGFEVLEELKTVMEKNKKGNLTELSSKFFTVIPHSFGRQRPPVINKQEILQKKMDMLSVLGDIEIAQSMQEEKSDGAKDEEYVDHPTDVNYKKLSCGLEYVDKTSEEFKIIETYTKNTNNYLKITDVWKVNRDGEGDRFSEHSDVSHRKLLWHGTNVAVVAAILKSGLRIMPHSGGRVGRGIYFASENSKSAAYVGYAGKCGIMFLNEVAFGTPKIIVQDDPSLRTAPKGFDSVLAAGRQEPDPSKDTSITIDGNKVIVPQGSPIPTGDNSSSFSQSEYLVYKESQARIRYLIKVSR